MITFFVILHCVNWLKAEVLFFALKSNNAFLIARVYDYCGLVAELLWFLRSSSV